MSFGLPVSSHVPSPMYPCIGYVLDSYYEAGIKDAIITAGYKFESLIKGVLQFKQSDQNILFSVEKEAAGTAGSIKLIINSFMKDIRGADIQGPTYIGSSMNFDMSLMLPAVPAASFSTEKSIFWSDCLNCRLQI